MSCTTVVIGLAVKYDKQVFTLYFESKPDALFYFFPQLAENKLLHICSLDPGTIGHFKEELEIIGP